MFRFFRILRHRLLAENRFSRYLLYAIGEIILVVIGILLALQINSWNQDRLAGLQEEIYLNRIIGDLETDLQSLEHTRADHESRVLLGVEILEQLGSNNLNTLMSRPPFREVMKRRADHDQEFSLSFGQKLFAILTINRFYQTDYTFQEMLQTGKIDLIRNQDLKLAIMNQYQYTSNTRSFQDEIVMFIQHSYREVLVVNRISTLNTASYEELLGVLPDQLLLQVELENYLQISLSQLNDLIYKENSLKYTTRDLIDKIKEYLNGK